MTLKHLAALALVTGLLTGGQSWSKDMQETDVSDAIQVVFEATSKEEEWEKALVLANRLRKDGADVEIRFLQPNSTEQLAPQAFMESDDALAIIQINQVIFVWKPQDKTVVDVFFLE